MQGVVGNTIDNFTNIISAASSSYVSYYALGKGAMVVYFTSPSHTHAYTRTHACKSTHVHGVEKNMSVSGWFEQCLHDSPLLFLIFYSGFGVCFL